MSRYRYTGDAPTVFTTLQKDGHTWVPSKGDEIEIAEGVSHPLLELVSNDSAPQGGIVESAAPREVETSESPEAADESKEN